MDYRYFIIDVFASKRFEGAQIAIVANAQSLSSEEMQQIANEFNLWRTVFLIPSEKQGITQNFRIFNHQREFDFGGHATLGAIYALAELQLLPLNDGKNRFKLRENNGEIQCEIDVENNNIQSSHFTSKVKINIDRFTPPVNELSRILSIEPHKILTSNYHPLLVASHLPYLFIPVDNVNTLADIEFDYKAWTNSSVPSTLASSIFVFSQSMNEKQRHFHCRLIGPNFGLHEDPPVGAAMPAFTAFLSEFSKEQKLPYSFVAERGIYAGRKSMVHVDLVDRSENDITVKIGGNAVLVSDGTLYL